MPGKFQRQPHAAHRPRQGGRHREDEDETVLIWGSHAVEAALANPARTIGAVFLTDNAEHRLQAILAERGLAHERVTVKDLDRRLGPDTVHQGALIECAPLPEPSLAEIAARAADEGPVVVLDQVTDPHNVGAILRSAAAFGAAGLVMTRRNSPPLGGALAKAASGALEHVPVALVVNLARALAELAEHGVHRLGLDGEAEELIEDQPLADSVALVLGAEGRGLRQLTRETCDRRVRIAIKGGPIDSLNVSNAAAVALHLAAMRRRERGAGR